MVKALSRHRLARDPDYSVRIDRVHMAQRVGLPANRTADGFAAVLTQLLNHNGVQVLETLPDGRTLRLHTGLLRDQSELR